MENLEARLVEAVLASSPANDFSRIVEDLASSDADLGAVRTILRVMEANPTFDFGVPGPLVHFVETFYRKGYEAELLASLKRQPTPHTVWMLHRIINDTKEPSHLASYIAALRAAGQHATASQSTKESVAEFLELHKDA